MIAALIDFKVPGGHETYLFTGCDALQLYQKLELVQDLDCLARMAQMVGDDASQLESLADLFYDGKLELENIGAIDVKLDAGRIKCLAVAETDEEIENLKQKYPKAICQ